MIDAAGYERLLTEARTALAAGTGLDEVLARLRRAGFSPVDSIRAVRALTGGSLAEAKEVVHLSPAWADVRDRADELHRSLEEEAGRG